MRLWRSTLAVLRLLAGARCGQVWRRLFALAAVAALPAIGGLPANAESVIRVSANTPVRTLAPAKFGLGALEYNYALLVYSRLVYFDEDLKPIPDLAGSWEASPTQKVWTFHLRHGVKFPDGRELDAEA